MLQSQVSQSARERLTEVAIASKAAKGLSWKAIAQGTGISVVFVTAAVLGQHPLPKEAAELVGQRLGLDEDAVRLLQSVPMRGMMAWLPAGYSRRGLMGFLGSATTLLACSCFRPAFAQQPAEQGNAIPGALKTTESKMLQGKSPISAINMYLDGFHFYADDMSRQIEAHHFCHQLNEEFFQCVIYDGNKSDSRLIGIEYIVSERIFKTLPEDEKGLWHSHRHEATSGELVIPGIPETVEHTAIGTLVSTYGKTWHTWQIDRDSVLPLGIPQLMMGFTQDGQLKPEMIQSRDKELGLSTDKERKNRLDLLKSAAPVQPGADGWQNGQASQLALNKVALKNKRG